MRKQTHLVLGGREIREQSWRKTAAYLEIEEFKITNFSSSKNAATQTKPETSLTIIKTIDKNPQTTQLPSPREDISYL